MMYVMLAVMLEVMDQLHALHAHLEVSLRLKEQVLVKHVKLEVMQRKKDLPLALLVHLERLHRKKDHPLVDHALQAHMLQTLAVLHAQIVQLATSLPMKVQQVVKHVKLDRTQPRLVFLNAPNVLLDHSLQEQDTAAALHVHLDRTLLKQEHTNAACVLLDTLKGIGEVWHVKRVGREACPSMRAVWSVQCVLLALLLQVKPTHVVLLVKLVLFLVNLVLEAVTHVLQDLIPQQANQHALIAQLDLTLHQMVHLCVTSVNQEVLLMLEALLALFALLELFPETMVECAELVLQTPINPMKVEFNAILVLHVATWSSPVQSVVQWKRVNAHLES